MVRFTDASEDAPLAPVVYLHSARGPKDAAADGIRDSDQNEDLRQADLESVVVRALSRKDLSEWEVTQLLAANGVESSEFEVFLVRYRVNGYVDDYAYAERHVESLHRRKGFGRSQISRELSAKHISNEIISDVLSSLDDDDELARAIELAEKRAPSLLRLDHATAERRLTSFLQRKGYPSSIIRDAVSKTLGTGKNGAASHPSRGSSGSGVRFR
jgi:regulatory protein